jgi:hypothetical protein
MRPFLERRVPPTSCIEYSEDGGRTSQESESSKLQWLLSKGHALAQQRPGPLPPFGCFPSIPLAQGLIAG